MLQRDPISFHWMIICLEGPHVVTIFPILIHLSFASFVPFLSYRIPHPNACHCHTSYTCNSAPCLLSGNLCTRCLQYDDLPQSKLHNLSPILIDKQNQKKQHSNSQEQLKSLTFVSHTWRGEGVGVGGGNEPPLGYLRGHSSFSKVPLINEILNVMNENYLTI